MNYEFRDFVLNRLKFINDDVVLGTLNRHDLAQLFQEFKGYYPPEKYSSQDILDSLRRLSHTITEIRT